MQSTQIQAIQEDKKNPFFYCPFVKIIKLPNDHLAALSKNGRDIFILDGKTGGLVNHFSLNHTVLDMAALNKHIVFIYAYSFDIDIIDSTTREVTKTITTTLELQNILALSNDEIAAMDKMSHAIYIINVITGKITTLSKNYFLRAASLFQMHCVYGLQLACLDRTNHCINMVSLPFFRTTNTFNMGAIVIEHFIALSESGLLFTAQNIYGIHHVKMLPTGTLIKTFHFGIERLEPTQMVALPDGRIALTDKKHFGIFIVDLKKEHQFQWFNGGGPSLMVKKMVSLSNNDLAVIDQYHCLSILHHEYYVETLAHATYLMAQGRRTTSPFFEKLPQTICFQIATFFCTKNKIEDKAQLSEASGCFQKYKGKEIKDQPPSITISQSQDIFFNQTVKLARWAPIEQKTNTPPLLMATAPPSARCRCVML